jgi:hypothetical protein
MMFSGIEKVEPDKVIQVLQSFKPSQTQQPLPPDAVNISITFEGSETIELTK